MVKKPTTWRVLIKDPSTKETAQVLVSNCKSMSEAHAHALATVDDVMNHPVVMSAVMWPVLKNKPLSKVNRKRRQLAC